MFMMKYVTNPFKTLPHLQINRFSNSLADGGASLGEQEPNSLLHICPEEPDLELFLLQVFLKLWVIDKVLRGKIKVNIKAAKHN